MNALLRPAAGMLTICRPGVAGKAECSNFFSVRRTAVRLHGDSGNYFR